MRWMTEIEISWSFGLILILIEVKNHENHEFNATFPYS